MSKFYDQADEIAAVLSEVPSLEGMKIVVDRQHDLLSELSKVVGRQTGNLILVAWAGGKNQDESGDRPRIESAFTVTIFSKPIIRKGEIPADDIAEVIASTLHDWRPVSSLGFDERLVVTGIYPADIPDLLAHQIRFTLITQL
jgi:hypothetical protein